MKNLLTILFIFCLSFSTFAQDTKDYRASILKNRKEKNAKFKDIELGSPLNAQQIKAFKMLKYFPPDTNFRVKAKLVKNDKEEQVTFQTSDRRTRQYRKFGTLHFEINGQSLQLSVYQSFKSLGFLRPRDSTQQGLNLPALKPPLFLPFRDLTTNKETYGGGRYLEIQIPKGDELILDFNLAYNPYCAYQGIFSCPIPPKENTLSVAIKAGEKKFK